MDAFSGEPSLLQALKFGGGGLKALARHAVAALLNAAHPDIDPAPEYDTPAEVIAAFQAAFASGDYETTKDALQASNESGCPLSSRDLRANLLTFVRKAFWSAHDVLLR